MVDIQWEKCLQWLIRCKALSESNEIKNPLTLARALRDGVILCKLLNNLQPNCINEKDINLKPQMAQFICIKNIRLFLFTCQTTFGLISNDLFQSEMLYDFSDFGKVLLTLSKLSRCTKSLQITSGFKYDGSSNILDKHGSEDLYKDFEFLADKNEVSKETNPNDQNEKNTEELYEQLCTLKRPTHQIFLTAPKDKREHCIRELVETEINYVKALKDVVTNFMDRMKLILALQDIRMIYGNIEKLIEIHEKFEKRLCEAAALSLVVKEKVEDGGSAKIPTTISLLPSDLENRLTLNGPRMPTGVEGDKGASNCSQKRNSRYSNSINGCGGGKFIGQVFLEFSDKFLVYGEYCAQLAHAQIHLDKLLEINDSARCVLWECQMSANHGKFHLRDLLALPVQRILKYHILIKELLKYTPDSHEEKDLLKDALDAILDLTFYINEVKRDAEGMELTNDIQRNIAKIDLPVNCSLNYYGRLLKDGELRIKSMADARIKNRFVFLFDTCMLMCKSTKSDVYNFKEAISIADYRIEIPNLSDAPSLAGILQTFTASHNTTTNTLVNSTFWKQKLSSHSVLSNNPKKEVKWSYTWLLVSHDGCIVYNLYTKTYDAWLKWMEALATAQDNLKPSTLNQTNHAFEYFTFPTPTRCTLCRKLLRGAIYQGYKCRGLNCGCVVHKECIPLVGYTCDPLLSTSNDVRYSAQPPIVPKRTFDREPPRLNNVPECQLGTATSNTNPNNDKIKTMATINGKPVTTTLPNHLAQRPHGALTNGTSSKKNLRDAPRSPSTNDIMFGSSSSSNGVAFAKRHLRNSLGGPGGGCKKDSSFPPSKINNQPQATSSTGIKGRQTGNEFITKSSKNFTTSKNAEITRELDERIKICNDTNGNWLGRNADPISQCLNDKLSTKNYCNLDLQDRPWFIGEMTRQEAKFCLQDSTTGTFLVRFSSHQGGNPVITLKFQDDVKHIKILNDEVKGYYISECHHFPNIVELISHYQTSSLAQLFLGINTTLAHPYKLQLTLNGKPYHVNQGFEASSQTSNNNSQSSRSSPSTSSSSSSRPNSPNLAVDSSNPGPKSGCEKKLTKYSDFNVSSNRGEDSICASNHTLYKSTLRAIPANEPTKSKGQDDNLPSLYVGRAVACFDFSAYTEKMISFKEGDKILVISKHGSEKGWWKGQILNRTEIGYFPLDYVTEEK